jgi:hypothetical protein
MLYIKIYPRSTALVISLVELFFSCACQDFTQDVSTVLDFLDQELQEDHAHERKKFIKVVGIVNNFFSTSNAIF